MVIAYNHEIRVKRLEFDKYVSEEEFVFKIERAKGTSGFYRGDFITFITGYVHSRTLKAEVIGVDTIYENEKYYFVVHVRKTN